MDKIQILVIGRHKEILETVLRLVNNNVVWSATGAATDEEAITLFKSQYFKLVLLGGGIEQDSEDNLCAAFRVHRPDIIIVQHYGGGSGLLAAEIYQALA